MGLDISINQKHYVQDEVKSILFKKSTPDLDINVDKIVYITTKVATFNRPIEDIANLFYDYNYVSVVRGEELLEFVDECAEKLSDDTLTEGDKKELRFFIKSLNDVDPEGEYEVELSY